MSSEKHFVPDAFFLGPKSENAEYAREGFEAILRHWFDWRLALFRDDPVAIGEATRRHPEFIEEQGLLKKELANLCDMLLAELPTYTPRYVGHMLSEISLPALFGHFAALLHNPNNTSREVSKVGARMESEAIAMLADMLGFDGEQAQGHFTGGGTVANFEAIWRARYRMDHALALALVLAERDGDDLDPFAAAHMGWDRFNRLQAERNVSEAEMRAASAVLINPVDVARRISERSGRKYSGPVLITPGNKHFSWRKAANIFGLGEESFWNAPLDEEGRVNMVGLRNMIGEAREAGRPVMCLATVAGTTEAGEVDPIHEVTGLLDELKREGIHIWHHVDAAYGGFFCSMLGGAPENVLDGKSRAALAAVARADSVTIDPHKLGYVPYSCGAFIARDSQSYLASSFHAPYIDRAHADDKWRSTLEGSRSAAGAAATWLTVRTMGFRPEGFGEMLASTIQTRRRFESALRTQCPDARLVHPADTNILCFSLARKGEALSESNRRTARAYDRFHGDPDVSLSRTVFSSEHYGALIARHVQNYDGVTDTDNLVLLRCVFMNPFWANPEMEAFLLPKFVRLVNRYAEAEG
ncbi:MAG: pyridoxal phosphate-dependent decarboxylase family protein [Alphaproteobacteria bacterium]